MRLKQCIFALVAMLLCAFSANAQVTTEAALNEALTTGGEVTLGADINVAAQIEIPAGKTVVLDLAGYEIVGGWNGSSTTNHIYVLSNRGTLTIKDSGTEGKIVSRGIYNYGELILESGIIDACDGNGGYAVNNESGSTFIMNGGVVSASYEDGDAPTTGNYDATALDVPAGCTATLNGGKITSVTNYTYAISLAGELIVPETSTVEVTGAHGAISISAGSADIAGGTFICSGVQGQTDNVVYVSGGSMDISGGTFEGDSDGASGGCCVCDLAGGATINGGSFSKSSGGDVCGTTGSTTINGGTFENLTETQHVAVGATITNAGKTYTKTENGTMEETTFVAKIGSTTYATFAETLTAASAMSGDVTIEVYDKVTLNTAFSGSYSSINFVGKDTDAEIYLDVQGYITATGKKVSFTDLTLSKSAGVYITNAGFMNVAFGIYDVTEVAYTNCVFANGAYASSGNVTFNDCTFYRSYDKYGLWAYGNVDVAVEGCTFADYRGIKMYAEGAAKTVDLTVKNTDFSALTGKPAIVLTYGESVVLEGNTYSSTGTFELDLDGAPNGTAVTSDVAPTCKNDNGTCGVLVDGKIYTTAAQAAAVAAEGSNVTLLYSTTDAVEFAEGVNLTLANGVTADNVTVATSAVAKIGETSYATLEEAFATAVEDETITLLADATPALTSQRAITKAAVIDLGGNTLTLTEDDLYFGTTTFKNGTIVVDPSVKPSTAVFWMFANQTLTFDAVKVVATGVTGTYLIGLDGNNSDLNLLNGSEILIENTTALDLDVICVNASTGNDIVVENSKVNVTNLDGRVFFRGNYTVKDSEVSLAGITKAGFRIEAGQTLSIEGTSTVTVEGEPRDGGIHITDATATYTKAETATVNATVNAPAPAYVAKIGETSYATLAEAVAAAQTDDIVTLLTDVETADGIVITDKNLVINLNGKTYTTTEGASTNNRNFKIEGTSVVTIKNGTMVAAGDYSSGAYGTVRTEGSANVTLEGLKLYNYRGNGLNIKACGSSVVTINDTEIYSNYGGGIESAGGTIEIANVKVEQKGMYTAPYNSMAISVNGGGKVTVNSGTFSTECITAEEANNQGTSHGPWVAGVLNSGGTLIINGGTFSNDNFGENSLATYARGAILADTKAKVEINGGKFNVLKNVIDIQNNLGDANNNPSVVLAGGTYNADPRISASYSSNLITLADGYAALPDLNGNYVVGVKPTATIENLGSMLVKAGEYFVKNLQGSGDNSKDMPLQFVMKYTADQTAEDVAKSPYKDWYADFVLSFTGLENGSFVADEDTYLAGFYGETEKWEGIWAKVGITGMEITEGTRYPVMMGVGMPQNYEYICAGVEEFLCAMNISSEILEANPDLKVTLELCVVDNSNDELALNALQAGGDKCNVVAVKNFVADDFENVELPEVEITDIKGSLTDSDPDLTFALNFTIKDLENLDEEYLNKVMEKYGSWYTDYVLTISGLTDENVTFNANGDSDGYLAGQYDGFGPNWVSVPFENVTLANNESIYIMEYAAKLMGQSGLRYTLAEIVSIVMDFDCGVYFTPEFLTANPGLKVDLHLKVFTEDAEGNKVNDINVATNNFDVEDYVAIVHATGKQTTYCTTLADAVAAAEADEKITLIADVELTETLNVPAGKEVVLDLNGKTISQTKEQTAGYQMILNDGKLTINDSSEAKTGKISYTDSGNGGEYISDVIYNRSVLVINGGTIENLSSATVASNGYPHAVDTYSGIRDTYVEINGGTIYCAEYSAIRMFCVSATNKADLVINGGTIKGAIDMQNGTKNLALGTLTINDGTFETTKNANNIRFANWNGGATEYGISAAIKGGSFNGGITTAYVPAAANWDKGVITGGTFAKDMTEYCAEGFVCEANIDGTYGIVADPSYIAELTIDDANPVDYTSDLEGKTVGKLTYKRSLIGGIWNPFFVPFEIDIERLVNEFGLEVAYYNQMISTENADGGFDYKMEVKHLTSGVISHYPLFVKVATDTEIEYVAEDVVLGSADEFVITTSSVTNTFKLYGTHQAKSVSDLEGKYAINALNGQWTPSTSGIKPHRLYFEIQENNNNPFSSSPAKSIGIVVRGEEGFTGIEEVTGEANENVIFDLQGRRILEPQKGELYIINGKKVIY